VVKPRSGEGWGGVFYAPCSNVFVFPAVFLLSVMLIIIHHKTSLGKAKLPSTAPLPDDDTTILPAIRSIIAVVAALCPCPSLEMGQEPWLA
jgi:hypothetical protein